MRSVIFVVALLVACSQSDAAMETPIVESVDGLPPFDALPNIALGQRARRIKTLRSSLDTIAYVGYADTVPGFRITYEVPGSYQDGEPPPDNSRLTGVEARAEFPRDSLLVTAFQASVNQATSRIGRTSCFAFEQGSFHGYAAVWALATGAELAIVMYPEQRLSEAASRPYRPALVLRVSMPDHIDRYTPARGDCPAQNDLGPD